MPGGSKTPSLVFVGRGGRRLRGFERANRGEGKERTVPDRWFRTRSRRIGELEDVAPPGTSEVQHL
jgi:hypothetical protein